MVEDGGVMLKIQIPDQRFREVGDRQEYYVNFRLHPMPI